MAERGRALLHAVLLGFAVIVSLIGSFVIAAERGTELNGVKLFAAQHRHDPERTHPDWH